MIQHHVPLSVSVVYIPFSKPSSTHNDWLIYVSHGLPLTPFTYNINLTAVSILSNCASCVPFLLAPPACLQHVHHLLSNHFFVPILHVYTVIACLSIICFTLFFLFPNSSHASRRWNIPSVAVFHDFSTISSYTTNITLCAPSGSFPSSHFSFSFLFRSACHPPP